MLSFDKVQEVLKMTEEKNDLFTKLREVLKMVEEKNVTAAKLQKLKMTEENVSSVKVREVLKMTEEKYVPSFKVQEILKMVEENFVTAAKLLELKMVEENYDTTAKLLELKMAEEKNVPLAKYQEEKAIKFLETRLIDTILQYTDLRNQIELEKVEEAEESKEVLKIEENVSIAKYLKPEAQAEAQIEEEKLQEAAKKEIKKLLNIEKNPSIAKYLKPKAQIEEEGDNLNIIIDNLAEIVAQNVDIRNQPLEFSLESLLKDEVCTIIETNIQKMNQLNELYNRYVIIKENLNEFNEKDTKEEMDKKQFFYYFYNYYVEIFYDAKEKVRAETYKLLRDLINK